MNHEPTESTDFGAAAARSARKSRRNADRTVVTLLFWWSAIAQLALVVCAFIGFLEVRQACRKGFGDGVGGRPEITFGADIGLTCRISGQSFEIPMSGAAAVIVFGVFGFLVVLLLGVAYRAFRRGSTR